MTPFRPVRPLVMAAFFAALALPAAAFERVQSRENFVSLVDGRTLTTLGVRLVVTPAGAISGRAFGRDVTGSWDWQDGYFCRSMEAGDRLLPRDCQLVEREGSSLRFTSEKGEGDRARLNLR